MDLGGSPLPSITTQRREIMNSNTVQEYIKDINRINEMSTTNELDASAYKQAVDKEIICTQWMRVTLKLLLPIAADHNLDRRVLAKRLWVPYYKTSRLYEIATRHRGKGIEAVQLSPSTIKQSYKGNDPIEHLINDYLIYRALMEAYRVIRYEIFENGRMMIDEQHYGRSRLASELGVPRWKTSRIGLKFHHQVSLIHTSAEIYDQAVKNIFGQDVNIIKQILYKWDDQKGIRTVSKGIILTRETREKKPIWFTIQQAKIPQGFIPYSNQHHSNGESKDSGAEKQH